MSDKILPNAEACAQAALRRMKNWYATTAAPLVLEEGQGPGKGFEQKFVDCALSKDELAYSTEDFIKRIIDPISNHLAASLPVGCVFGILPMPHSRDGAVATDDRMSLRILAGECPVMIFNPEIGESEWNGEFKFVVRIEALVTAP